MCVPVCPAQWSLCGSRALLHDREPSSDYDVVCTSLHTQEHFFARAAVALAQSGMFLHVRVHKNPHTWSLTCTTADGAGVDLQHVADAPPVSIHETFWLPHGAPVVLNVAALVPHKGQRHLIDGRMFAVTNILTAECVSGEGDVDTFPDEAAFLARVGEIRARMGQGHGSMLP